MDLVPRVFVAGAALLAPMSIEAQDGSIAVDGPGGLSANDWSSIREAKEANRHAARATEDGFRAHNPRQRWSTRFDGLGFTTEPDAGDWTWGLELVRYGFGDDERTVATPEAVGAEGRRVEYDWDDRVSEWYVNDTRGLEHGYTVHRRPPRRAEDGPLTFTLVVRGELTPEVQYDARGVRFLDADGAVVVTYSGLTVFDAGGRTLPARFDAVTEGLLLSVDERGALYPLTVDPVAQQAYLKASNTGAGDAFGIAVAVSGDTVVGGARQEDSAATGINGDQSDDSLDHHRIRLGANAVGFHRGHQPGRRDQSLVRHHRNGATRARARGPVGAVPVSLVGRRRGGASEGRSAPRRGAPTESPMTPLVGRFSVAAEVPADDPEPC